ncbi:response regulator transcription factor [Nostoc sp. PCC 7107]|uniref:response regulator transcription factor n=1 Tax=Nostoc sp. PCC 7107 TaxID=317936 RepID=UPI00029EE56E|nr:response regulator [Nostoc sp. PCC 7107]AFY44325.1 response regulator receiver protein [Nostoc sp. PCC 7107]
MNKILIAEDEVRIATFIEKGLRKNGFLTAVASDGKQALQMASNKEFTLLLLDLGLPIKDGWSVLQELRSQDKVLPIILLTAMNDERHCTIAFNLGANAYVNKPFRFSDLLEKINLYLENT